MDTNMDRGDTRHSQLEVPVVHQEAKKDVDLETEVVQVDSHDVKIMKRVLECCCEVEMEVVVYLRNVSHERDDQTVVAPMVHQCGDQMNEGFQIKGLRWGGMEPFFAILWGLNCCDRVYAKICEKYELVNDVKLHVHEKMWKSVPENVVKGQEYHEIKYDDSMNALVLQSF